jgi:hypothetical protein
MTMPSRRLTLHLLFSYALPLLSIAYGYFFFYQLQTHHVLLEIEGWQFLGILLVDSIGLALAIRWKNNYLGSLYIAFLLLTLSWGALLAIGEGGNHGFKT